jgi:AcrR family transcriptional regulator
MAPPSKGTARPRPRKTREDPGKAVGSGPAPANGSILSDREIVRGARELVAEVGVDGLTMRRLSAKLGVALGATYHHVPTKRDLLLLLAHDLYDEVIVPKKGSWDQRIKKLMLDVADVVGRYPGMASFMNANADDSMPLELSRAVTEILADAGFGQRDINAVRAALFFYVTGMSTGSFTVASTTALKGVDIRRLFEDGLDILLAGARVRLESGQRGRRGRRST